jgi:hexokinase
MARDEQVGSNGLEQVETLLAPLTSPVKTDTLLQLARGFALQYRQLASDSTEHFLATQVVALPTGQEAGSFIAIDLGGTNLRVEFVELLGDNETQPTTKAPNGSHALPTSKVRRTSQKAWPIEAHLKYDMAEDLFAWIGDCIAEVIEDATAAGHCKLSSEDEISIGVTFSFPMTYASLELLGGNGALA